VSIDWQKKTTTPLATDITHSSPENETLSLLLPSFLFRCAAAVLPPVSYYPPTKPAPALALHFQFWLGLLLSFSDYSSPLTTPIRRPRPLGSETVGHQRPHLRTSLQHAHLACFCFCIAALPRAAKLLLRRAWRATTTTTTTTTSTKDVRTAHRVVDIPIHEYSPNHIAS